LTLKTGVQLEQGSLNFLGQDVHTFALLEAHNDVGRTVLGLAHDFKHVEFCWQLFDELVDESLDSCVITATATAASRDCGNGGEEGLTLSGEVTNFSVGMETEHLRFFIGKLFLNIFPVTFAIELKWIRALETRRKSKLHLLENLRADKNRKIGVVGTTIPVISNMATVHDLTVNVGKIGIGYLFVLGEIVVEHITANGQITIIEIVVPGPALGAELLATNNKRVEHAETEEKGLEFRKLVSLSLLEMLFVELGEAATHVGLQILRGLVSDLDGILENRFRNDILVT
jgi:hypothetical protein